jgi:hypothetical protein
MDLEKIPSFVLWKFLLGQTMHSACKLLLNAIEIGSLVTGNFCV